jgi:hypothetical protein
MRSARLLIAAGVFGLIAGLACSSDSLTDPNAPPGLSLRLSPSADTFLVGDTIGNTPPVQLTLTAKSLGLPVQTPTGVVWTSANASVAIVSGTGLVSPTGLGTTTVTARVNGERATSTIVVAKELKRLSSMWPTGSLSRAVMAQQ